MMIPVNARSVFSIISTYAATVSIGIFIYGINAFVDYFYGTTFAQLMLALEAATAFAAFGAGKYIARQGNIGPLLFASLFVCIVALLYENKYTEIYYVAWSILVLPPVALLVIFLRGNAGDYKKYIAPASAICGMVSGLGSAVAFYPVFGAWKLLVISLSLMAASIALSSSEKNIWRFALAVLVIPLLYLSTEDVEKYVYAINDVDNDFPKPVYSMIKEGNKYGFNAAGSYNAGTGRIIRLNKGSTASNRQMFEVVNASYLSPSLAGGTTSIDTWKKRYPLTVLPYDMSNPGSVLVVGKVNEYDGYFSSNAGGASVDIIDAECPGQKSNYQCAINNVNTGIKRLVSGKTGYDLVSMSLPHVLAMPAISPGYQFESITNIEILEILVDSLNDDGILAINLREELLMHKMLIQLWNIQAQKAGDGKSWKGGYIDIIRINNYAENRDAYNYLLIYSRTGLTGRQLSVINDYVGTYPVERVGRDLENLKLSSVSGDMRNDAIDRKIRILVNQHGRQLRKKTNLDVSHIYSPDFYQITNTFHQYIKYMIVALFCLLFYGLLFSGRARDFSEDSASGNKPSYSVLMMQSFAGTAAYAVLAYLPLDMLAAGLGYSSLFAGLVMLLAFTAFSIPFLAVNAHPGGKSRFTSVAGAALFALPVFIYFYMGMELDELVSGMSEVLIVAWVTAFSFIAGSIQRNIIAAARDSFSNEAIWAWVLSGAGIALGFIFAKYMLFFYSHVVIVLAALCLYCYVIPVMYWSGLSGKRERVPG